jgi:hypothetical protein
VRQWHGHWRDNGYWRDDGHHWRNNGRTIAFENTQKKKKNSFIGDGPQDCPGMTSTTNSQQKKDSEDGGNVRG